MKKHSDGCMKQYPNCLCVTCQHDHDSTANEDHACCTEHENVTTLSNVLCYVIACPDYIREEETP